MKSLINPTEWVFEFQQRGAHPPLMGDMWCQALYQRFPQEIGLVGVEGYDYLITSENKGYYKNGMRDAVLDAFKGRLREDPAYLQYVFERTEERVNEFETFMGTLLDEFSAWDDEQWANAWNDFIDRILNLVPWYYIPWYITEFNLLSDQVTRGLESHREEIETRTDLHNAAMVLMFPDKGMGFQEEQASFYNLVQKTREGVDVFMTGLAAEHLNLYGWKETFFFTAPTGSDTVDRLRKQIEAAIAEKTEQTYLLQMQRRETDKGLASALEKVLEEDADLLSKIRDARRLAWLLTWSVESSMKSFAKGMSWYQSLAERVGLPYERWLLLTVAEVKDSLKAEKCIVPEQELADRERATVVRIEGGELTVLSGKAAEEVIEDLQQHERDAATAGITELKGKPASPGKVRGVVRVAVTAHEAHIVEEGDILVCGMTTPDYVPAMKRAAAIVTDEGGLLCHAAIISRELGKPCVIATKVATHVLKTGDMVEVDADAGTVTLVHA